MTLRPFSFQATIEGRHVYDLTAQQRIDVARVTWHDGVRELIMLFARFDEKWEPTWVGPKGGESVRLPRGFSAPPEILTAIDRAWSTSYTGARSSSSWVGDR